jgi:hypothetical protein
MDAKWTRTLWLPGVHPSGIRVHAGAPDSSFELVRTEEMPNAPALFSSTVLPHTMNVSNTAWLHSPRIHWSAMRLRWRRVGLSPTLGGWIRCSATRGDPVRAARLDSENGASSEGH